MCVVVTTTSLSLQGVYSPVVYYCPCPGIDGTQVGGGVRLRVYNINDCVS